MRTINLTKQQVTLVDDEEYDNLNQYKWYAQKNKKGYYAVRRDSKKNGRKFIWMHRLIMKTPRHLDCDHIYHNTLDNRKFIEVNGELKPNLRNCTRSQNLQNAECSNKTGYKGVTILYDKYITAKIKIGNKTKHLGVFDTLELAEMAYDNAARKQFGEFANLNF
jgi:hypothetical protein